ncbi:hypothetical protein CEXT_102121 [Caerostris extrusa]|uniref:Uncharacterized protein n=1 Tax=Caerostris extrusa TaxID=172846 RepID=A0AAV4MX90_CAEEX|nr:hypothetical protein CEXT_102121 [Caerostris extrusa]
MEYDEWKHSTSCSWMRVILCQASALRFLGLEFRCQLDTARSVLVVRRNTVTGGSMRSKVLVCKVWLGYPFEDISYARHQWYSLKESARRTLSEWQMPIIFVQNLNKYRDTTSEEKNCH